MDDKSMIVLFFLKMVMINYLRKKFGVNKIELGD